MRLSLSLHRLFNYMRPDRVGRRVDWWNVQEDRGSLSIVIGPGIALRSRRMAFQIEGLNYPFKDDLAIVNFGNLARSKMNGITSVQALYGLSQAFQVVSIHRTHTI